MIFPSQSLDDTRRFGRALANVFCPGDVIALIGELGAGKTLLVQSIAAELGIDPDAVHSPTFVLIQEYDARIPLVHIDAYRLDDVDQFLELGADELLGADNVSLLEWADRVENVLPRDRLTIRLTSTGETSRQIEVEASGPRSQQRIADLEQRMLTST